MLGQRPSVLRLTIGPLNDLPTPHQCLTSPLTPNNSDPLSRNCVLLQALVRKLRPA